MSHQLSRTRLFLLLTPLLALLACLPGCLGVHNPATEAAAPGEYLFCFWNTENFFDDKLDNRPHQPDKSYDAWFAENPRILHEKLDHLSSALMELNGGKGPDILALAEVESERAVELLRDALNDRLADKAPAYKHILYKDPHGGRHIATALLTRLDVDRDRTRLLGRRQRILEGRVLVNDHELVVIVSHWTSRLTDREGSEKEGHGRSDYADKIYGAFRAMWERNRDVAVLICGDFNDTPDDTSVTKNLHATGDLEAVRANREPLLLDLFAGKDPNQFGTHYYRKWLIFDHIVVSPGLLNDRGWSCDPDSVQRVRTPSRLGDKVKRPWSFGSPRHEGSRGYSDHFPVTVKLRVQ
jgi:endonuclease/exonuclease/phosphatase family metal-dependent hydrolase